MTKSISTFGFGTDGLWHAEADSNRQVIIPWDRNRITPAAALHPNKNFGFITGAYGSETEHLIGHWKCDDNAASTTIVDETGNYNGTLIGGNNTQDIDSTDSVRGTSLLLDGTADYLDLSSAIAGLTSTSIFTIIVRGKPNFTYDAASQTLFGIGVGSGDLLLFPYAGSTDNFRLWNNINGADTDFILRYYTENISLQQWHTAILSVNLDKDYVSICLDGEMFFYPITQSWAGTVGSFFVGKNPGGAPYGAFYVDEVMLVNGCLLPYGAPLTLNNQVGNYYRAHADLTCFLDFEGATTDDRETCRISAVEGSPSGSPLFESSSPIIDSYSLDTNGGGTNYYSWSNTANVLFDITEGTCGLWVDIQTLPPSSTYLTIIQLYHGANDSLTLEMNDTNLRLTAEYNGTTYQTAAAHSLTAAGLHFFRFVYSESSLLGLTEVYMDEVYITGDTIAQDNSASAGGTLYIGYSSNGLDCFIDGVFIYNKANAPQCWSMMGKEIWTPELTVS